MMIGDEFSVFGDWFKIHFIENNGMAFGMELGGGKWGKTVLSVFRLVAVVGIAWYLRHLIKQKAPTGVILSFGLIFCGAVGNIIDSMFYGMIFNDSYSQVATLFPALRGLPARVGSVLGQQVFRVLPSGIQLGRLLYHDRRADATAFPSQVFCNEEVISFSKIFRKIKQDYCHPKRELFCRRHVIYTHE